MEQRTNFDLEMMEATGSCNGIENYSRYLTGRTWRATSTLFEYIPNDAIIFADESHVAIPQLGGMYEEIIEESLLFQSMDLDYLHVWTIDH